MNLIENSVLSELEFKEKKISPKKNVKSKGKVATEIDKVATVATSGDGDGNFNY